MREDKSGGPIELGYKLIVCTYNYEDDVLPTLVWEVPRPQEVLPLVELHNTSVFNKGTALVIKLAPWFRCVYKWALSGST